MAASHGSFPARHSPPLQSLPWVSASPHSHTVPRSLGRSPAALKGPQCSPSWHTSTPKCSQDTWLGTISSK